MADEESHDPRRGKENTQALAKIQHSKAHGVKQEAGADDKAPLVADPRNRLADGKIDPATKELKPKEK
jgi:hypothetical protein